MLTSMCLAVAWNGSLWVAGGFGTNVLGYSYDGINWTASSGTLPGVGRSLAWNGTLWIVGGSGGNQLLYSYDGINWGLSEGNSLISVYVLGAASRRILPYIGRVPRSPVFQCGSGTSDGSAFTLAVTFVRAFPSTPNITATVSNGSASWVSVGSASATGFTAYTWNASGGVSVPLNWTAIL